MSNVASGLTRRSLQASSGLHMADSPGGFVCVDVDPGTRQGRTTSMTVTYYRAAPSHTGTPTAHDRFVLRRPRADVSPRPRPLLGA